MTDENDDFPQSVDLKDLVVETIYLSPEDQCALAKAILNPPPPAPALERAIQRHSRLITAMRQR
jgi:hypothetical protein